MISDEGGGDGRTDQSAGLIKTAPPALGFACTKPLDWDGPVTEVLSLVADSYVRNQMRRDAS